MGLVAEIERVLERVERGEANARLEPAGSPGRTGLVRRLNLVLGALQEAQGWRDLFPRELSLAQERYEELLRVLSALRRLSEALCRARTPEEVCSWAARVLAEELEFEHCSVLLYDRERDQLREVAASDRPVGDNSLRCSARRGALGRAFCQRLPTLVFPARKERSGFFALAPLRAGEERLGLIKLARPLRSVPTRHIEHGLVILSAIAAQMLKTVELKRRLDELNQGLARELERHATQSRRRTEDLQRLVPVLDELIECSERAVFVVGKGGRLLKLNRAAVELLGWAPSEVLGSRFTSLLPQETRRAATAALLGSLRSGGDLETSVAVRTASGLTTVDLTLRRIADPGNKDLYMAIAGSPARPQATGRLAPASGSRVPRKLLIIDDEVQLLESLRDLLSACDHEVTVAASAQEGVRKATREDFDLVLTDLGMPEMNGYEVAERIKARRPSTAVGVMTGWDAEEAPGKLKAHGVDFVLRKPFNIQEILDWLEAAPSPTH
jgi:PAS domain S-box-containing protein